MRLSSLNHLIYVLLYLLKHAVSKTWAWDWLKEVRYLDSFNWGFEKSAQVVSKQSHEILNVFGHYLSFFCGNVRYTWENINLGTVLAFPCWHLCQLSRGIQFCPSCFLALFIGACQAIPKCISGSLEMSSSSMRQTILISTASKISEVLQT